MRTREVEDAGPPLEEDDPAAAREAEKALLQRPGLSIRTRLSLGFLSLFLVSTAVTVAAWFMLTRLEVRLRFLETVDRYTMEVQQARRFEKNYLLYGTNLAEVREHLENARRLLHNSEEEALRVLTRREFLGMKEHLDHYDELTARLAELERTHAPDLEAVRRFIEPDLRSHGSQMVAIAMELSHRERSSVRSTFTLFKRLPALVLVIILVLVVFIVNFLARQMVGPLGRLVEATGRFSRGDFTPIVPARKYRDEFTNLAVALNTMMRELQHRQEVLLQSHKMQAVGTLTAGVAHELNNPINNIVLTAEMLKEDYATLSDAERLDMVDDLVSQAERAQRTVKNLLDFARQSEITSERLSVEELLKGTVDLAGNQVRLKGAKIALSTAPNLPPIHGDRQALSQVFLNLLLNALDAVAKGGHVWIDAAESDYQGYLQVRVRDDGHGIPSHILANIFDPFFTTKSKGKGTGLGLSVSLGIVRQHGGDIRVDSVEGQGAVFTVLLPASRVPAVTEPR